MKKRFFVLMPIIFISGCAGFLNAYKEEYKDPKKSFVVLYVRYDADTYGDILYLRPKSGKSSQRIFHFRNASVSGIEKAGTCLVFGGLVDNDVYEIAEILGRSISYKFESNAPYNIKVNITQPDIYFVGQYDLGLSAKGGLFSSGAFSFKKANGCPNEKTAYQEILKNESFSELMAGTRWPDRLKRKIESAR